jgi:hypothetical protein
MKKNIPLDIAVAIIMVLCGAIMLFIVIQPPPSIAKSILQVISGSIMSAGITIIIYWILRGPGKLRPKLRECGIRKIFRNREKAAPEVEERLNKVIEDGGRIDVLSIAATQFFLPGEPFCRLRASIDKWKPKSPLTIRFALIDPLSGGAIERIKIEECKPGDAACRTKLERGPQGSKLFARWYLAFIWLRDNTPRPFPNITLDYCFYKSSPVMYLIAIDGTVFVEQYHNGNINEGEFIAGHMPVIQYEAKSDEGKRCLKHLHHIWTFYSNNKLDDLEQKTSL